MTTHEQGAFDARTIRDIREKYVYGASLEDLALEYDRDKRTIAKLLTGRTYQHVPNYVMLRPVGRPSSRRRMEDDMRDLRIAVEYYQDDNDGLLRWLDSKGWMFPEDSMDLGIRLDRKDEVISDLNHRLATVQRNY
jgi:hypothetical protein